LIENTPLFDVFDFNLSKNELQIGRKPIKGSFQFLINICKKMSPKSPKADLSFFIIMTTIWKFYIEFCSKMKTYFNQAGVWDIFSQNFLKRENQSYKILFYRPSADLGLI
jgi:hypothetical protein